MKNYNIIMQYPSGAYSLLWHRKNITLAEAKAALAQANIGWPNKGRNKGRQLFLCSPARAKRLLTYTTKSGQKRVNTLPLGLK
jgi:hypothetical protein